MISSIKLKHTWSGRKGHRIGVRCPAEWTQIFISFFIFYCEFLEPIAFVLDFYFILIFTLWRLWFCGLEIPSLDTMNFTFKIMKNGCMPTWHWLQNGLHHCSKKYTLIVDRKVYPRPPPRTWWGHCSCSAWTALPTPLMSHLDKRSKLTKVSPESYKEQLRIITFLVSQEGRQWTRKILLCCGCGHWT